MADKPKSFVRRDRLRNIEQTVQQLWSSQKVYEANIIPNQQKHFVTFPYPYMNGRLHLGHAFSISKTEFDSRFRRMQGINVLFPQAFHCSGMPIQANALRLRDEIKKGEKGSKYQILQQLKIPEEEIPNFQDPQHWLRYFPPLAKQDLQDFGLSCDWRRSFITTDINPYYDSFIRWQFNKLKAQNLVDFGKRHTIFSIIDNQPCADHDRMSGEEVKPQEYTLIKIKVLELPNSIKETLQNRNVYLVAATLRPETMYGQTNCFILPSGEYGIFEMKNDEVFICSERSMLNMAYQDMTPEFGKFRKLGVIKGQELIGCPLKAPLTPLETVYALPMQTISMSKGTGVVTSVPSDAPDDYITIRDLKTDEKLRQKYKVSESWLNFEVIPIIQIPDMGEVAAVTLVEQMNIKNQFDKEKLKECKDKVYLKGFNEGQMLVGICKGLKVKDAKNQVRQHMIENNLAAPYYEPESQVIGRSGDECIVAFCDQWILKYGQEQWKQKVQEHINTRLRTFNDIVKKTFQEKAEWLGEWACSRTQGLGTRLPWDQQYLIESLSDSTIYFAFYTVAHLLQGDMNGSVPGEAGVKSQDITEQFWDYIFLLRNEPPTDCNLPLETLNKFREQFQYWYPMDMRSSGKDLIPNHLLMSLYNHAAIWKDQPHLWPRSFFCNGHLMLNAEKMSKSTGNFLTLQDAIEKFGADATRIAIAQAGDSLDDANFEEKNSNSTVLKITTLLDWITENKDIEKRTDQHLYFDRVFLNEINYLVGEARSAYDKMNYQGAVKHAFYELLQTRDNYRQEMPTMHLDCYNTWVKAFLLSVCPIAPHFTEHLWGQMFQGLCVNQTFPEIQPVDMHLLRTSRYIRQSIQAARDSLLKLKKKTEFTHLCFYVATSYQNWQIVMLDLVQEITKQYPQEFNRNEKSEILEWLKKKVNERKDLNTQKCMQFVSFRLELFREVGEFALEKQVPFDEKQLLLDNKEYICQQLKLQSIDILTEQEGRHQQDKSKTNESALPGKPTFFFYAQQQ